MSEEITYKQLRDLVREEKAQPGLCRLPPEFYESVKEFLASKYKELQTERSLMQMREFENSIATIKEISAIRRQKILFEAIRSGGAHTGRVEQMTKEEHELYDRICAIISQDNERIDALLSGFEKGEQNMLPSSSKLKKVRFTKDVPAYRGSGSKIFGPFKGGEEELLPSEEAEWLIKGKLAELVE
ncbi:MAG: hypothetical protein N3G80_02820 [Candidatus Micrarchaeota archaeon]|nr:hypothetical protein [Candidatus Micrarchaeota archaeon]